jgi:hypothetical protein
LIEAILKSINRLFIILWLLCPVAVNAQARPATCQVAPTWVGGGLRSSVLGVIYKFQTDGKEGQTIRSFAHEETGLIITVGIDYVFARAKSKLRPDSVSLAIIVSNKEEKKVFESVENTEASTHYDKKWNLAVTKNFNFDNRVYMFTLRCHDGVKTNKR